MEMSVISDKEQMLNKLDRLRGPLQSIFEQYSKIEQEKAQLEKLKKQYKRAENQSKDAICIPMIIMGGAGCLILAMLRSEVEVPLNLIVGLIVVATTVALAVFTSAKFGNESGMRTYQKNIDELQNALSVDERIVPGMTEIIVEDIQIIPQDYRYPLAVEFIYKCLLNQRAQNISEAVNLYEDQLHKWRMEQMQEKLIEMSKQQQASLNSIKHYSGIAAAASVAGAIF